MPLYKTITVDSHTSILIWHITETVSELRHSLHLTENCKTRVLQIKAVSQQKQFLSVRQLLKVLGCAEKDLYYDADGKPHLSGEQYISVSHSHQFAAIITGRKPVGIDIEKQRDKILRIAHKFTPLEEYNSLANTAAVIRKLTIVWGAKEAIYKILNIRGLSFLNDIYVEDFDFEDKQLSASAQHHNKNYIFNLNFTEFDGFTCVYALSSPPL